MHDITEDDRIIIIANYNKLKVSNQVTLLVTSINIMMG